MVPNVKNVQDLTVLDVAQEMTRLMDLGYRGKLGADDLVGGTFTISNIGSVRTVVSATHMRKHVCVHWLSTCVDMCLSME